VPPAANPTRGLREENHCRGKGVGARAAARVGGAEQRRARGRARSALRGLTCRSLFERSERSEFRGGPRDRAAQGSQVAARGLNAEVVRRSPRPHAFAHPALETNAEAHHAPFRRKRNMNHEIANVIASKTIASDEP